MVDLIYKDLCYQLLGIAFEVHNALGNNLREKTYADALEEILKQEKIAYQREFYYPLKVRSKVIGKRFFDFIINDQIILELKVGNNNFREAYSQIFEYLKSSGMKLGLVIRFTNNGVKYKRIPNIY